MSNGDCQKKGLEFIPDVEAFLDEYGKLFSTLSRQVARLEVPVRRDHPILFKDKEPKRDCEPQAEQIVARLQDILVGINHMGSLVELIANKYTGMPNTYSPTESKSV